ncbi:MAG: hypothetical protein II998_11995, partial [Clostridia bacterium]|nr:hypothetical protein [Clostridia bacterium]
MKKILSLLLCVALVLSVCSLPVFASGSIASAKEAQKVLSDLGIIEANAELSDTITRGEFALEISKAMNIVKMPSGYKLPYADVAEGSKCYEGVYNLYAWRVISEAPYFRPDDVITSHEALKIAVATLGYDFLALANGGYPTGYVAAATQLGIVPKGMNANLTVANAYELIYNMLHCKLSTVTYTDSGEYNYSVKTGNTVLYEMWGLSVVSGTVTDGETFGINYDDGVGEGFVGIDGMKLKKGAFDTDSYFGESVDVYYENDSKIVRAILPRDDGSNKITKIVSSQDIKFENNTYTYMASDDEEEEEKISDDCTIVYNGQNVNFDKSIMVPEHGSVKLVSLDGGKADVVIIKSYEEMVAGTIVTSSLLISDKATTGNSVIFDGDNITYADQNGNVSDFGKIVENDVLWIAYDKNGEINDVIICSDLIVGELTGKSSNGIYIDDRMYTATDVAYADATQNYEFGSVVRGCINPDGDIVYFVSENDTTGYKIGYLMYSRLFSRGLSSEIRVKILGSDGLYYEYAMADKFIVNGIVFKDEASANYA